jgi:ATP-dependent helicase YprA (DUF1998 family)
VFDSLFVTPEHLVTFVVVREDQVTLSHCNTVVDHNTSLRIKYFVPSQGGLSVLKLMQYISHDQAWARSYQNLHAACKLAGEKSYYDSLSSRKQLENAFRAHTNGWEPYEWQLDAAEAFLLGLDCLVIAGTGAGKTLPFVMPAFIESKKIYITISPLNALEADQVSKKYVVISEVLLTPTM